MLRMLDTDSAPTTAAEWEAVKAASAAEVFAGYVDWGNPAAATPPEAVAAAREAGLGYCPILVPDWSTVAGLDLQAWKVGVTKAIEQAQAAGYDQGPVVAMDLEEADWTANAELCLAEAHLFAAACAALKVRSRQYGPVGMFDRLAQSGGALPTEIWAAYWVDLGDPLTWPPSAASLPGVPDTYWSKGQRCWQFAHGSTFAGYGFDCSVCDTPGWVATAPAPAPAPDPAPTGSTSGATTPPTVAELLGKAAVSLSAAQNSLSVNLSALEAQLESAAQLIAQAAKAAGS